VAEGAQLVASKVCLVTGAGSGIGRACAVLLAREGASRVVVGDLSEEAGRETVELIEAAGGAATFVACDVSRGSDVQNLVATTVSTYGRLDCAINNAGISHRGALVADIDEEQFDRVIAVNLKGTWLCLKHEIPELIRGGGGSIVNTASRAALRASAPAGGYIATKHAVLGLTKSAAIGYRDQGIRINCICPGVVRTPMVAGLPPDRLAQLEAEQPGRLGEPEEMAEAAVWLCSDRASFVSGVPLPVDLTWTAGS